LYAALAAGGELRLLADETAGRPEFLPPAAARSVADVLTRPLPDFGPRGIAEDRHELGQPRRLGPRFRLTPSLRYGSGDPTARRCREPPAKAPRTVITDQEQRTRTASQPSDALRLLFPTAGALLSADGQVTIRVMGGRHRVRRDVAWLPSGPGFYRLTALDADGAAVRAAVQARASR
jgi:penicillin-binding protein 1C